MDDSNFFSTKFALAVILTGVATSLMVLNRIDFTQFKELVTPIVGFYFAANVAGKFANILSGKTETKVVENVPRDED